MSRRRPAGFPPIPPWPQGGWRRRRRRVRNTSVGVLLLLLVFALLDRAGYFKQRTGDHEQFDRKPFVVTKVIDGDTLEGHAAGQVERTPVRLLGIDAPEHDAYFGPEATAALRQQAEGKIVTLNLQETQTRDKYDRLLAYVYVTDSMNYNQELVRQGMAYAHRRFTHPLRGQFESAEHEARKAKRGLWREVTIDQMPPWRQDWLQEQNAR